MTTETQLVYYLIHKDTGLRLKWYRTLIGARIAQRQRNHRLGFLARIKRITNSLGEEQELCTTADGTESIATYTIVEDTLDRVEELYIE